MTSTESFEEWKKEQARCVRALATSQGTDTYSAFLKALPMILREGAVKFPERTAAAPEIADGIVAVLSDGGVANATEFAAWVRRQARFWIGEVDRLLTLEVWPDRASGAGKDLLNDIVEQVRRGRSRQRPTRANANHKNSGVQRHRPPPASRSRRSWSPRNRSQKRTTSSTPETSSRSPSCPAAQHTPSAPPRAADRPEFGSVLGVLHALWRWRARVELPENLIEGVGFVHGEQSRRTRRLSALPFGAVRVLTVRRQSL